MILMDSMRGGNTFLEIITLCIFNLGDLLINAAQERFKQFNNRRLWLEGLWLFSGLYLWFVTGGILFWVSWAITLFLLIPWDVGTPPTGTFAEAVNYFFETEPTSLNSQIIAYIVIALDLLAFAKIVRTGHHKLYTIFWRCSAIHVLISLASAAVALAGMAFASLLFPDFNVFEGDQSRGVAYVYWGLIVSAGVILFFAKQAFSTPFKWWFGSKFVRQVVE